MTRLEDLNKHLNSLAAVNEHGDYEDDIRNTVNEINKELGIGTDNALSSYSTKELHEELLKREGIREIMVLNEHEAVISNIFGDLEEKKAIKGPARILINQD